MSRRHGAARSPLPPVMAQVLHGWRGLDVAEAEAVDVTRVPVEPTIVLEGMTRPSKAGLTALRQSALVHVAKQMMQGENRFVSQEDYALYFAAEDAKETLRLIEREFPPETHWKEDVP